MPNIFADIIRNIADNIDKRGRHEDEYIIIRKNRKNSVKTFYSDNHRHITSYVNLADEIVKDYKVIADEIHVAISDILQKHMPTPAPLPDPVSEVANTVVEEKKG